MCGHHFNKITGTTSDFEKRSERINELANEISESESNPSFVELRPEQRHIAMNFDAIINEDKVLSEFLKGSDTSKYPVVVVYKGKKLLEFNHNDKTIKLIKQNLDELEIKIIE